MLGREGNWRKQDELLAHGAMRIGRVVRKWGETEKGKPCKGGQHMTSKDVVAKRGRAYR